VNSFIVETKNLENTYIGFFASIDAFLMDAKRSMSVAEARGVVTLCLAQDSVKLGEYTPNQIKQSVTGTASANKELVERCVKLLLGLETEPKPDHAADALAGAITHINHS
jgi:crossover junction endodeoxyribonuclease RuvC